MNPGNAQHLCSDTETIVSSLKTSWRENKCKNGNENGRRAN